MAITKTRRGSKRGSKSRSLTKRKNNGTKRQASRSKASRRSLTRKNRNGQRGGGLGRLFGKKKTIDRSLTTELKEIANTLDISLNYVTKYTEWIKLFGTDNNHFNSRYMFEDKIEEGHNNGRDIFFYLLVEYLNGKDLEEIKGMSVENRDFNERYSQSISLLNNVMELHVTTMRQVEMLGLSLNEMPKE